MKKSVFALILSASAAFAAANGAPQPEWNHANDSGTIAGLTEVKYPINPSAAKSDDRVKFTVDSTGTREDDGGLPLSGRRCPLTGVLADDSDAGAKRHSMTI